MAIIVVGGSGQGAGKTALICGLIRATPRYHWTAVKITTHAHGHSAPVYEETAAGQGTDTSRYLAAGARRALLLTAHEDTLGEAVNGILDQHLPSGHLIFESNSVLHHLRPDLCFAVSSDLKGRHKPSFEIVERCAHATVALAGHDHVIPGQRIHFHLRSLERISPTMLEWLHEMLAAGLS
ncbi:MAG: hypothetical protein ABSD70_19560 [Terracidiphilus sp.]|jgi:hypothetical protein